MRLSSPAKAGDPAIAGFWAAGCAAFAGHDCAVDQNDTLDGRVGRRWRRKSGAYEESQNQAFHGAAPLMFIAKANKQNLPA
jgi:hypothetical protein